MTHKVIGIGNNKTLKSSMEKFLECGFKVQCIISLEDRLLPENSFNLEAFANKINCEFIRVSDINLKKNLRIIKNYKTDIIFSIWPKLLSKHLISIPKIGVIGSHPTPLPFNRGRHPIHWQITQFIKNSKLTFFLMDKGIDSGKIILKLPYKINFHDNIDDINKKIENLNQLAVTKIVKKISNNNFFKNLELQNNKEANYWRKKSKHDVLIDFRMNANIISSIIRSFSPPYSCAFFIYDQYIFHVSSIKILSFRKLVLKNIEPGKIIQIKKNKLIIKCLDKIIELKIIENDFNNIKFTRYIEPPSKYLTKYKKLSKLLN